MIELANYTLEETRKIKVLLNQIRALRDTIQSILDNKESVEYARYSAFRDMASIYNDLSKQAKTLTKMSSVHYSFNTDKMRGYVDILWPESKGILEQVLVATKMLYATLEGDIDFADDEFDNLENFLKSSLRTVIFNRPEKEIEVQNAIESLFLGLGMNKGTDYDRETGKFKFSEKEFIPDFIIPNTKSILK